MYAQPSHGSLSLLLAANGILVSAMTTVTDRGPSRTAIDLPATSTHADGRRALAVLRRAGWDCHQRIPAAASRPRAIHLTGPAPDPGTASDAGALVDALLWRAGFDRHVLYRSSWGYAQAELFDDPASAYVAVHRGCAPDDRHDFGSEYARTRAQLAEEMRGALEAEGWTTLQPACMDHSFHAIPAAA